MLEEIHISNEEGQLNLKDRTISEDSKSAESADSEIQAWQSVEPILIRLKHTCFKTHRAYEKVYITAKANLKYYDVPIIVLSSINSVFIAGARAYLDDMIVSVITCIISLIVGIVQSLKTFFKIDEHRENALSTHKDLFKLFCELSTTLDQPMSSRGVDAHKYLADKLADYTKIQDKAIVVRSKHNPIYDDSHPYSLSDTESTKQS